MTRKFHGMQHTLTRIPWNAPQIPWNAARTDAHSMECTGAGRARPSDFRPRACCYSGRYSAARPLSPKAFRNRTSPKTSQRTPPSATALSGPRPVLSRPRPEPYSCPEPYACPEPYWCRVRAA
eukprot:1739238-Rhodomonas_salina.1